MNISVDTILSYLTMIKEAFLIHKVGRHDVIEKRVLRPKKNIILRITASVKQSPVTIKRSSSPF